jgi:amino acid transporter
MNSGLAAVMGLVIAIFFVAAARYISSNPHLEPGFFTKPFFDPQLFNFKNVVGGTSVAVLTYIGFDGISTLSEEVENPRRNILLATVTTCFVIGILSALEVYVAQLLWPASIPFPDVDTAFGTAAAKAWAPLAVIIGGTLLVANFGSGMGAQIGAARLLYGMGRSKALPQSFFGAVDPVNRIPRNNVLFVGAIALIGAFIIDFDLGANMLNFGALIAFMGVNAAAFIHYYLKGKERNMSNLLPPVLGFIICFILWISLSSKALIAGSIWMAVGIAFGAWKTRGFRGDLVSFDIPADNE